MDEIQQGEITVTDLFSLKTFSSHLETLSMVVKPLMDDKHSKCQFNSMFCSF